ncbi:MAG: response regulator, partial [Candidatus Omnitrophota bacterium]
MEYNKTILLIEDEADLVQLIKFRLQTRGYEVVAAYDGIEALEKLNEVSPDLIILDINLPKMSGIEFYNKISTPHGHSKYPVLVLTARRDLEMTFKNIEADGFMAKPFEIDQLIIEIERIIKAVPSQVIFLIDFKESSHVQEITAYLKSERYAVVNLDDFAVLQEKAKEK